MLISGILLANVAECPAYERLGDNISEPTEMDKSVQMREEL